MKKVESLTQKDEKARGEHQKFPRKVLKEVRGTDRPRRKGPRNERSGKVNV